MLVCPLGGQLDFVNGRAAEGDTIFGAFLDGSGDFLPRTVLGGRSDTFDDVSCEFAKASHQWFAFGCHHVESRSMT
jgi:hypothetical protein